MSAALPTPRYDGATASALADRVGVPRVVLLHTVGSTLDEAHRLAADGAPDGTLVLADRQTAGRGRQGKAWSSPMGTGIWLTLLACAPDPESVGVLALRLGLAAAAALEPFAEATVRLRWEDVAQDGRIMLTALAPAIDWTVWNGLLKDHPGALEAE
ncbi:MAG TPA: hypothetical protein VFY16_02560, partial [Gemmatimonadaceae bacterium]|nr:hypothetical protein [Gemmatimonadaceae bacterium]